MQYDYRYMIADILMNTSLAKLKDSYADYGACK
jgi:hypothetical protein